MNEKVSEAGWWTRVFGAGGAKLSIRQQNEILRGELDRAHAQVKLQAAEIQEFEERAAFALASNARRDADSTAHRDTWAQQRLALENIAQGARTELSAAKAQLEQHRESGQEQARAAEALARELKDERERGARAEQRMRALAAERQRSQSKILKLTAANETLGQQTNDTAGLRDSLATLNEELARRALTAAAQLGEIAAARDTLTKARQSQREAAATHAKALKKAVDATSHEGRRWQREHDALAATLAEHQAAAATSTAHAQSMSAVATEVIVLLRSVGQRWLGDALPLALSSVEPTEARLDAPSFARVANALPLDIEVVLGATGRLVVQAGPATAPGLAQVLESLCARLVDDPGGSD